MKKVAIVCIAFVGALGLVGCKHTASESCADHGGVKQISDTSFGPLLALCEDGSLYRVKADN